MLIPSKTALKDYSIRSQMFNLRKCERKSLSSHLSFRTKCFDLQLKNILEEFKPINDTFLLLTHLIQKEELRINEIIVHFFQNVICFMKPEMVIKYSFLSDSMLVLG